MLGLILRSQLCQRSAFAIFVNSFSRMLLMRLYGACIEIPPHVAGIVCRCDQGMLLVDLAGATSRQSDSIGRGPRNTVDVKVGYFIDQP